MTPEKINAAMPIGQPMPTDAVRRALEPMVGRPLHPGEVVNAMRRYPDCIEGGLYTTRWREWKRIADIPEPEAKGPNYPCEVRFDEREIGLETKSSGTRIVRVTLPREPWVTT